MQEDILKTVGGRIAGGATQRSRLRGSRFHCRCREEGTRTPTPSGTLASPKKDRNAKPSLELLPPTTLTRKSPNPETTTNSWTLVVCYGVLALLDDIGSPATVATTGGRYYGFVIDGTLPAALAANWLAGAWDQNAAMQVMSPVAAKLEEVVLEWMVDLLGLPSGSGPDLSPEQQWQTSQLWPRREPPC